MPNLLQALLQRQSRTPTFAKISVHMAAETDSAPRASEMVLSDTILVKVGAEGKGYTLHKRLLIHHSDYFKGALSGKFRETDDGVIQFEDMETDAFDVFVDWMYEKRISFHVRDEGSNRGIIPVRYHAYVLADRLIASGFKKVLLDAFLDVFVDQGRPSLYHAMTYAFNNLATNDPLLQILVDAFVINKSVMRYQANDEPARHLQEMPQEGLTRLFLKMHKVHSMDCSEKEVKLKREDYKI